MSTHTDRKLQNLLAEVATARGFSSVEGAILGVLFLHSEPQTQRNIAKAVDCSQSTVSRALQRRIRRGIVDWTRKSGSREMLFSASSESPKGLIVSGIYGWLKTNSLLRSELELLISEQDPEQHDMATQVARDLINAIDSVNEIMEPIIRKLQTV